MAEYGLLVDYEYCTGCESCVVACKETHDLPVGKWGIRVFDDGPWQKDDSGEGGDCFNWNKIPVPTDLCDLCATAWPSAWSSAPSRSWPPRCSRSPSRCSGAPARARRNHG